MIPSFLKSELARRAFLTALLSALTPMAALSVFYVHSLGVPDSLPKGLPVETVVVLLTLLSMCMAALLSIGLARRSVTTLHKLQDAMNRVKTMDFNIQIDRFGEHDFEALADSLTGMAGSLEHEFDALRTVEAINSRILSSLDKDETTAILLSRLQHVLPSDALAICLCESIPRKCLKIHVQGEGLMVADPIEKRTPSPEEVEALRQAPGGVLIEESSTPPYYTTPLREYGVDRYILLPVFVHQDLAAVLVFGFRGTSPVHGRYIPLARQVANEFSIALSNIQLIGELEKLNLGTMTSLARVIDAKSPWTAGHSERVAAVALKIGRVLGLSEEVLQSVQRGALLHDIGKVGIPVRILDKPGRLTKEEREIIESHVEVGPHILEPIPSYGDLLPMVRHHHESFDGTGYPDRLSRGDIDFRARVLAVADVFDALTHDRPYRKSLGREAAVAWIWQMAGRKFDPTIVDAFLLVVNQEGDEMDGTEPAAVVVAGMDDDPVQDTAEDAAEKTPRVRPASPPENIPARS